MVRMARLLQRTLQNSTRPIWIEYSTSATLTPSTHGNQQYATNFHRGRQGPDASNRRSMSIFRSTFPDIEIPEIKFFEFISKDFNRIADKPAIIYPARDVTYNFGDIRPLVRRIGSGLTRHGFKPGDVCCIFMKNNAEFIPMVFAVSNIGGIVTTSNPVYTADELRHQLKDSGAKYIVTTPDLLDTIRKCLGSSDQVENVFLVGDQDGYTSFADLASDDGTAYPSDVTVDVKNDVAFLLYSSGTTGLPKGVMLTHYNLVGNTLQTKPLLGYAASGGLSLLFLPLFHVYGLVVASATNFISDHGVVILDRFDGREFLSTIEKYKLKQIPIVPPVVSFLVKSELVGEYNLTSLTDVVSGAAPLSADMQVQLKKRLNIRCRQGYGMTETGPAVSLDAPGQEPVVGSAGLLLPNTEVRIIDPETGNDLNGLHQEGEIIVRGPQIMKGYLNNREATDDCIRDGWMHTGDVGYVDESGRLFVVDRVKELIKYKGFQVAPAELEGILGEHPDIADSGVIGIQDEDCGELPKAFVVLKKDRELSKNQVVDFVAERVSKFKHLKGGVEFIDEIPRAASGKILRRKLRQS